MIATSSTPTRNGAERRRDFPPLSSIRQQADLLIRPDGFSVAGDEANHLRQYGFEASTIPSPPPACRHRIVRRLALTPTGGNFVGAQRPGFVTTSYWPRTVPASTIGGFANLAKGMFVDALAHYAEPAGVVPMPMPIRPWVGRGRTMEHIRKTGGSMSLSITSIIPRPGLVWLSRCWWQSLKAADQIIDREDVHLLSHLKRGFPVFRVQISADHPDVLHPLGVDLSPGALALTPTELEDRVEVSALDSDTREDILLLQELYTPTEVSVLSTLFATEVSHVR